MLQLAREDRRFVGVLTVKKASLGNETPAPRIEALVRKRLIKIEKHCKSP
jgi:hypothetical protein